MLRGLKNPFTLSGLEILWTAYPVVARRLALPRAIFFRAVSPFNERVPAVLAPVAAGQRSSAVETLGGFCVPLRQMNPFQNLGNHHR